MGSFRKERVASLLQQELGTVFLHEKDTLFGGLFISVTKVRPSPDFGSCKVYLSIMDKVDTKILLKELNARNKQVRGKLSERIGKQVRRVPELHFYIDDSLDYAEKIDNLLN